MGHDRGVPNQDDIQSAQKFVRALNFPDLTTHAERLEVDVQPRLRAAAPPSAEADPAPSAKLIKGQITAFTAGLTGQDKQDVEYTTLAAQLNSDVEVPDNQSFAGMQAWFKNYASVMSNLGWIMSFDWEKYNASTRGLTMDKVVLEILAAVASQNGAAIAKSAIDALQSLDRGDGRLRLFNNSTMSDKAGKFLLGVASKQNDAISLAYGAFAMDYRTRDTGVLWFEWKSSDVSLYKDQKQATFNQAYYARGARSALETKLSDHAPTYVDDLDLGL